MIDQVAGACRCSPLHQLDGMNGFVLDGVFIPGAYLVGSKELHGKVKSKSQKTKTDYFLRFDF
jgi:hypothetical protein